MQHRFTRRASRQALAVAMGIAALGLTACGGGSGPDNAGAGTSTGNGEPAGEPVRGGTLKYVLNTETGCIDPQQSSALAPRTVGRQFLDSLTYQGKDGKIRPWLATSWKVSDDASTYTFTLRDDVTFSDGTKLTPEVVKANIEGIIKLGAAAQQTAGYVAGYEGSDIVDDHTIRIRFDHPNAQFLQATAAETMGILSEKAAKASAEARCRGDVLVGSGPFVLEKYTPNQSAILTRRDGYKWAPEGVADQGDAYLDRVEFPIVTDGSVRAGGIVSGQFDIDRDLRSEEFQRVRDAGINIVPVTNPGLPVSFWLNPDAGVLKEKAVRQAVQAGVDREALLTTFSDPDFYTAGTSVLSPNTPGYEDMSAMLAYDPDKANRLLDEAGWTRSGDGIRTKNGQPLRFTVEYLAPAYNLLVPLMSLAQQQLREIGVDMKLEPVPVASGSEQFVKRQYEAAINSGTRADPDVLSRLRGFSPELDEQLDKEQATLDPDKRQQAVTEAQRMIIDEGFLVPTYNLTQAFAYRDDVHGIEHDANGIPALVDVWKDQS